MCTAVREPEMTASLAAYGYVPTTNLEKIAEEMRNAISKESRMIAGGLANEPTLAAYLDITNRLCPLGVYAQD